MKHKPRKTKRKDTEVPRTSGPTTNVADEALNKEMIDSLVRAATTASSLEVEHDSGNINKTQSKAPLNESSSQGTDSGGGPRCQEAIRDTTAQTRISDIDADEGITLVSTHVDVEMFDADKDLHGEEVFVAHQDENVVEKEVDVAQVQVSTIATTATISIYKVTLAQALVELKHTKPKAKAKGIVFHVPEESTTTTAIPKPKSQDKGKAKMIEAPVKLKKKDQIMLNEDVALKLQAEIQAEFNKEQRLAREKAQKEEEEANIALIES
nr:hypothetical protein [Tanacetum cinerariifolium]